jgi:hypothetical protein
MNDQKEDNIQYGMRRESLIVYTISHLIIRVVKREG